MTDNRLPGNHRLKSRKRIAELFTHGHSVKKFPIRIQYRLELPKENDVPFYVGFVVSKRNFKKAVDRNRIKRQMRECFRLNKKILTDFLGNDDRVLELMIIYIHKEKYEFDSMEKAMIKSMNILCNKLD